MPIERKLAAIMFTDIAGYTDTESSVGEVGLGAKPNMKKLQSISNDCEKK